MNEWAILWTAILAAGSLIGVTLIVRPLTKTVGALERAVKAQKDTIDAAKSLNELTAATLAAVRPREILQDVAALREMAELKAKEVIDQERRKLASDRKGLEDSRSSWLMASLMIFARWVPAVDRDSAVKALSIAAPPNVLDSRRLARVPMQEILWAAFPTSAMVLRTAY